MSPTRSPGWLVLLAPLLCLDPSRSAAQPRTDPPKRYAEAARVLEAFIAREVEQKRLPALSIALVDDQSVVWARGFGFADAAKKVPATAETVYRVGSVSKLFTDLAVMQLVEQGKLDLDAPVTDYLPDFKPKDPFGKKLTLRQMMAHRSGLLREPPVGSYFDPTDPPLAKMVASLNQTALVYPPGERTKYSNAAIATVGYVLEKTQQRPFAKLAQERVLAPLGMKRSSFEPVPELMKNRAAALMWTYQGREFPAPTFELGMAPAGCMVSTVTDLARFLSVLFADGKGPNGTIAKPETLRQMLTPQYPKKGEREFGLGFALSTFEGRKRIGHGGAIYGFSTELAALPDERLGVVVISARDISNAVTTHIADEALRQMLAVKAGKPLPKIERTSPIPPAEAKKLAGHYQSGDRAFDLIESAGRLYLLKAEGGFRMELRAAGDDLIVDDVLAYGDRISRVGDKLRFGGKDHARVPDAGPPAPPPARWKGLIGEYGWDHNTLYILEKDRKLHALIEWFFLYPLTEESENVYRFPDVGLYPGERLVFTRDGNGRATKVEAASVVFARRKLDGENGETFRIQPVRPVVELRKEALAAKPPAERGDFRPAELVDPTTIDPTIKLDVRYASDNNFMGVPLYTSAKAFMQRPAVEALGRAHKKLAKRGYGLLIHDAYRPWHVTKMFWDATPEKWHHFVADPSQGSRHNRGCAVDLTLYDLKTGKPVEMVSGFDEFSDRSYPDYLGGTSRQRWHRDLLRRSMEEEGFTVYEAEWWHFDYKDWRKYRISNLTFEELAKAK